MSGSDSDYTGTSGDSLEDSLPQLQFIGNLVLTADAINIGEVGWFRPAYRYGSLVIMNRCATADYHSVMDETHIVMTPQPMEVQ